MLESKKNNIIIMKKSFICSFYAQPFPAFQFSYHSMECTDMIDKNEAVAGRDHAIHVSLTVRFLNIPSPSAASSSALSHFQFPIDNF